LISTPEVRARRSANSRVTGHGDGGEGPGGHADLCRLGLAPPAGTRCGSGGLDGIAARTDRHRKLPVGTGTALGNHAALWGQELNLRHPGPGGALRIRRDALDRADRPEHHGPLHPGDRITGNSCRRRRGDNRTATTGRRRERGHGSSGGLWRRGRRRHGGRGRRLTLGSQCRGLVAARGAEHGDGCHQGGESELVGRRTHGGSLTNLMDLGFPVRRHSGQICRLSTGLARRPDAGSSDDRARHP
jgi:hypothetical protein